MLAVCSVVPRGVGTKGCAVTDWQSSSNSLNNAKRSCGKPVQCALWNHDSLRTICVSPTWLLRYIFCDVVPLRSWLASAGGGLCE